MTKEKKQRIYDAMLIRAWRKDINLETMRYWLKPYDICIIDPELIRTPKYLKMRVMVFVGSELKPLGDKLFDHAPTDDIKILNWLGKSDLRCQRTDRLQSNDIKESNHMINKDKAYFRYERDAYIEQKSAMTPRTKIKSLSNRHR